MRLLIVVLLTISSFAMMLYTELSQSSTSIGWVVFDIGVLWCSVIVLLLMAWGKLNSHCPPMISN